MTFRESRKNRERAKEAERIISQLALLPSSFNLANKNLILECLSLNMEDTTLALKEAMNFLTRAKQLGLIHVSGNNVINDHSRTAIIIEKSMPESPTWPNDGNEHVKFGDAEKLDNFSRRRN